MPGTIRRSVPWNRLAALVVILVGVGLCLPGCGGDSDSDNGIDLIDAVIHPNGTQNAPNLVRLTGTAVGDVAVIQVAIGGPTTSDDLYSFVFDLLISDTSILSYVAGSATFGDALTLDPGDAGEVLADQDGNRVAVGVTKLGSASGNAVAADQATVVTLQFRVLRRDQVGTITITGFPPGDPEALDSDGSAIDSITFDDTSIGVSGL